MPKSHVVSFFIRENQTPGGGGNQTVVKKDEQGGRGEKRVESTKIECVGLYSLVIICQAHSLLNLYK